MPTSVLSKFEVVEPQTKVGQAWFGPRCFLHWKGQASICLAVGSSQIVCCWLYIEWVWTLSLRVSSLASCESRLSLRLRSADSGHSASATAVWLLREEQEVSADGLLTEERKRLQAGRLIITMITMITMLTIIIVLLSLGWGEWGGKGGIIYK